MPFSFHPSVLPPDTSTLFTTSGMQKHKLTFQNPPVPQTIGDVQHCLRLGDLDEIGDGTHYLDFWMLGLFSFGQWSLQQGVDFWMGFLTFIGVEPDTVTIPPHRPEWRDLYQNHPVKILIDPDCVWSDGSIGGDCTEFYKEGVEIGNIVRPLDRHLDCGFGGDRIWSFLPNPPNPPTSRDVLTRTIDVLIDSGIKPGSQRQGYVLRKLIRKLLRENPEITISHPLIEQEQTRYRKILTQMPVWLKKHPGRDRQFFWDTFGIHPDEWEE